MNMKKTLYIVVCLFGLTSVGCGLEASIRTLTPANIDGTFMNVASSQYKTDQIYSMGTLYTIEGSGGAILREPTALTSGGYKMYLTDQSALLSVRSPQ